MNREGRMQFTTPQNDIKGCGCRQCNRHRRSGIKKARRRLRRKTKQDPEVIVVETSGYTD